MKSYLKMDPRQQIPNPIKSEGEYLKKKSKSSAETEQVQIFMLNIIGTAKWHKAYKTNSQSQI
jgi:hypothetical protein